MKKIIIDTNAWMSFSEMRIDLFSELERLCDFPYEVCVLQGSLRELEKIKKEQRGKYFRAAKLAAAIIKAKKVKVLPGEGNVDNLLTAYSHQGNLILTQDAELKKRLTKPYFTIRQKKYVMLVR